MEKLRGVEISCELLRYRKKKCMSQSDLAAAVGCSKNTISSLERGEFLPTLSLAVKLAYVLDTDVNCLFVARLAVSSSSEAFFRFIY